MVKINATDLKGFKLVLEGVKGEKHLLATFDSVEPKEAKNDLLLHLVQGNKWSGEPIAELLEGRILCLKGSFYSRASAVKESSQQAIGKIA